MTTNSEPAVTPPKYQDFVRHLFACLARGTTPGALKEKQCEIIYALGYRFYEQGRFDDAVKLFELLVLFNPKERRYIMGYAGALQMHGDLAHAIQVYTIAAIHDLSDPAPCLHTCECLIALGKKKEAAEGLEMVILQCDAGVHDGLRARAETLLLLLNPTAAKAAKEIAK